jgi:hypothetical protein
MTILKSVRLLGLLAVLTFSPNSFAAIEYNYGFNLNGIDISGSFKGDASGDLISNISNIVINVNGAALDPGQTYFSNWKIPDLGQFQSGGGIISFSGLRNNFGWFNVDYPNNLNYNSALIFAPTSPSDFHSTAIISNISIGLFSSAYYFSSPINNWSVTQASLVPLPPSIIMFASGLFGFAALRRKANQVQVQLDGLDNEKPIVLG